MNANKLVSPRYLLSDLQRVDAHTITEEEYTELPELTTEMIANVQVKRGGRPLSSNPRKLLSLRLPIDVIERWRATGSGWQSRMAEKLSEVSQ